MRMLFLLLLSFLAAATSSQVGSHSVYSLSYEAVVGTSVIDIVSKVENASNIIPKGYAMFTALATEIAGDIVQLFSDTKTNAAQQDRNVEMDRRCYETLIGGGRCNIDHVREGEVTIQIVVSYDISPDQSAMVRVEATVAAMAARNLLIQSIPMINKQLDCYQGMLWSISKRQAPADRQQLDHGLSLEKMVLERHDLEERTRIAYLEASHPIEIWQYTDGHVKVRTLFVDGYLRSTTHVSGAAHAEALVHPAMLSVVGVPESVVIISLEPTAILKEVLKHARVQSILLVGADTDALALAEKYMPSNNDCSFIGKATTACLSQPNVRIVNASVTEWLTAQAESKDIIVNVVLVDVPPDDDTLLSLEVQRKLRAILSEESVVVVASGSAPKLGDTYDLDARHSLLQQAPRATTVGGLSYFHVYVYDEVRELG
ncbi:spermidine synthase [Fragilaria crotonensis]|nr:spermidine synthase [Fragilaria crotonensis]